MSRYTAEGRNKVATAKYDLKRKAEREAIFCDSPDKRTPVKSRRVVILSDLHFPFEDPEAIGQAYDVIESVRPDTIILAGDVVDCYAESRFLKDPAIVESVTAEGVRRVRTMMDDLSAVPQKIWIGGNHEARWKKCLHEHHQDSRSHPIVLSLLALIKADQEGLDLGNSLESFKAIYGTEQYGFAYYPEGQRLYLAKGNLVITHGKYLSRHAGYTAKRTFEWLGKSCIVGHSHRQGTYRISQDGREHGAWENGCLCLLNPEYDDTPNWQQGLSVVKIDGPEFHVVQIPIIRRGGKPVAVHNL
jgi:predicted phosphodiesterase